MVAKRATKGFSGKGQWTGELREKKFEVTIVVRKSFFFLFSAKVVARLL